MKTVTSKSKSLQGAQEDGRRGGETTFMGRKIDVTREKKARETNVRDTCLEQKIKKSKTKRKRGTSSDEKGKSTSGGGSKFTGWNDEKGEGKHRGGLT